MDDGCVCQECDLDYKIDLMVPDDLWVQIKPNGKSSEGGLLCPRCIVDKLVSLIGDGFSAFSLQRL